MLQRRGVIFVTNLLERCKALRRIKSRKHSSSSQDRVATSILNPSLSVDFNFWSKIFDEKHPILFKGQISQSLHADDLILSIVVCKTRCQRNK